jgi:hypothetical protein
LSPIRRLLIGAIIALAGAIGYVGGRALFRPARAVIQPIAFNHQIHVEGLELECNTCHEVYESGRHAGLPSLEICTGCHEEADPNLPETARIVELVEAGENDVFRKLFKLADHAFYSHRTHVVQAGLKCESCHGEIAGTTAPPERPLRRISMEFCVDCHEREDVRSDCTTCHR